MVGLVRSGQKLSRAFECGISAAVSMHPCRGGMFPSAVDIPIMFTAGTRDTICTDGASKSFYGSVSTSKSGAKILFDVLGANHFEPTDGMPGLARSGSGSELPAIGLFFAGHLGFRCSSDLTF